MSLRKNDTVMGSIGAGIFLLMMFAAFVGGADTVVPPPIDPNDQWWTDVPLEKANRASSGSLNTGASETVSLTMSEGELVRNITAILTWTDETDPPARRIRRHENQPDTFSLALQLGNLTESASGANPQGGEGRLEVMLHFTDEQLKEFAGLGPAPFNITVELTQTGIWLPVIGAGRIGLRDDSNGYDLSIEYDYYSKAPKDEEGE